MRQRAVPVYVTFHVDIAVPHGCTHAPLPVLELLPVLPNLLTG